MAHAATSNPDSTLNSKAAFLCVPDAVSRSGVRRLSVDFVLAKHILKMALPVVLGMLTQTAINVLDTVMVGHLPSQMATKGQAAIGPALPVMWLVGGFLSAVWVGTQAITSRRAGEGNDLLAGRILSNSLLLSTLSSVIVTVISYHLAPGIMRSYYADPELVGLINEYLQTRLLGVPAMVMTFSFKSFFDGLGRTKIFMGAAMLMNVLNIVFNYLLIFGADFNLPLLGAVHIPLMGVKGAALASVLAAYIGLFYLIAVSFLPSLLRRYGYYRLANLNRGVVLEIVRLSLPNGFATVFAMLGFSAFYWVVGRVNDAHPGAAEGLVGAANQVVVTTTMVSFMTSLAFGMATAAIVSQCIGAKRPELAEHYGWDAAKLWAYLMFAVGLLIFAFPDFFLALSNPNPQVIELARVPTRLMAVLQAVAAVATILSQTLYGVGSAKFVMYVELTLHFFVMAPVAYVFGLLLNFGLLGVYVGPSVYVLLMAAAMVWKFARGDWKEIVI